ncbi:MAG: hypothetical protein JWP78_329 [Mucilaginibacter sp.]|nr:hypothetical protein [Mucilaginibacter sp.]
MDTYHGRFSELIPFEKITEVIEFETQQEAFKGEMLMRTVLQEEPCLSCVMKTCQKACCLKAMRQDLKNLFKGLLHSLGNAFYCIYGAEKNNISRKLLDKGIVLY